MEKLDPKVDRATSDIVEQNVEQLKTLFPEIVTEGKVDFDMLREVLGNYSDEREERYSFTWNGKSRARRLAQTPSTGTLRPCPEESVNWDTTQNLFIEGDNLEVLKLLQKSYHKKIKMIYIDPPYNTGNDFIYPDDFRDSIRNYLELTGQTDEAGKKLSSNAETSGRYHTDWLNMIYPRLRLARNLLADDGILFMSTDDTEASNARKVLDEIFGEENFLAIIAWEKRYTRSNNARLFYSLKDSVIVYRRSAQVDYIREPRTEKSDSIYSNPDNDPRGSWASSSYVNPATKDQRPNLVYAIENPHTGVSVEHPTHAWKYDVGKHSRHVAEGRLWWGRDGTAKYPRLKNYLSEADAGLVPIDIWDYESTGTTDEGGNALKSLFDGISVFENPKPPRLIKRMARMCTSPGDYVLDFFAGSCSTAQALLELNSEESRGLQFVLVQLPELCEGATEAYKAGYATIAEIGKERIRRVIKKLQTEHAEIANEAQGKLLVNTATEGSDKLDLGFKVLKLDTSNIKAWDAEFEDVEGSLLSSVENVKPDRGEADVLYELLLKFGLDLAVPMEPREIAGRTVHIIGAGALIVCLADDIGLNVVEGIAALKEELSPETMRVVFKDSGFADDVVKTNAVQILHQAGIEDVKSL